MSAIVVKNDGQNRIFFDKNNGAKIRVSLDGSDYVKSTTPELVDLKITDYCPYKCSFCYQASLPDGNHGDLETIKSIVDILAEMQVFEIAIGGGEPVKHPQFAEILHYIYIKGIIPNFTCFGKDWLHDNELMEAVCKTVGGIGVSVHDTKQISKYKTISKSFQGKRQQILAQHVFGTMNFDDTLQLVQNVEHVLLLGYKTVGFGNSYQPYKFIDSQIEEIVSKSKKLSVDTAFIDNYGVAINKMGIREELMSSPEGKFSMYIDAVDMLIAPSSYIKKSDMDALKLNPQSVNQLYKTY